MASVDTQSVPAELQALYQGALQSAPWQAGAEKVRRRYPWRVRSVQGCRTQNRWIWAGWRVTNAMCEHRYIFGRCVECFNNQPQTGGWDGYSLGPRGRDWWFTEAIPSGQWYYNYFMQQTLNNFSANVVSDWCAYIGRKEATIQSNYPNNNYGGASDSFANESATSGSWITYIARPTSQYNGVWLWSRGYYSTPSGQNRLLKVWGTNSAWVEGSITWNNAPKDGKLLGYYPAMIPYATWFFIPSGGYDTIYIQLAGGLGLQAWASDNYGNNAYRPRWVF